MIAMSIERRENMPESRVTFNVNLMTLPVV